MIERPNPMQVLADELLAAGVDRLTAAGIVAKVSEALMAAKQADDMEAWRARADERELPDSEGNAT